ncbi:MAG TPA: exosortase A [Casimicrobiaceae bacterium]
MASRVLHQRIPAGRAVAVAVDTPPAAPASARAAWRHALPALVLVIVWILAWYASTAMGMVRIWSNSETFAHGFVVPPIVLWLIWRRRADLAQRVPQPALWGLAPLAIAGLAWLAGRLGEVNALAQLAMTAMIVLAVPAVLGVRIARRLMFPLAFLFFAVPIGDFVLPVLMDWTANFTVAALRASGIPVYREGLMFIIPSGAWSVIEACSGVRYLIASLMVGTLFAYLSYRSNRRRWLFVGFAILVPIIANWVRAYLIVLLGHLLGNRLAVGVDHIIYGWLFFGFVITLMFWIGGRWREDDPPGAHAGGGTARSAAGTAVAASSVRASRFWAVAAGAMLVSVLFPLAQSRFDAADAAASVQLQAVAPAAGWNLALGGLTSWRPVFGGASATFDGRFIRGSEAVGFYVAYYRDQDSLRKLVSSSNVLVRSTDPVWRQVATGSTGEVIVGDTPMTMATAEIVRDSRERLVACKFYWIDGKLTTHDYLAKLYTAWARLRNGRDDSAAVVVYVRVDDAKVATTAAIAPLQSLLREQGAAIIAALVATRQMR